MDEIHQTRDNTVQKKLKKTKKKGSSDADVGADVDADADADTEDDQEEISSIENFKGKDIRPYLEMICRYSKHTHMILLSATPIYNIPSEIEWILNLLLWNDDRGPIQNIFKKNKQMETLLQTDENIQLLKDKSRGYVSYVRGENPFTFPIKLSPRLTHSNDDSNNDWNENDDDKQYWYPNNWTFKDSTGTLQKIHPNTIPYFYPDYFTDNQYNLFLPQLQTLKKGLYTANLLSSYSNIIYPSNDDDSIPGRFDEHFKKNATYKNQYVYKNPTNKIISTFKSMKVEEKFVAFADEFYRYQNDEPFLRLSMKGNKYFNAGVMFVDLKLWKKKKYSEKSIALIEVLKDKAEFWDQDILNSLVDGDYLSIDNNLNYRTAGINVSEPSGDFLFVHYSGKSKPWDVGGIFEELALLYHDYYQLLFGKKYHITSKNRKNSIKKLIKRLKFLRLISFDNYLRYLFKSIFVIINKGK